MNKKETKSSTIYIFRKIMSENKNRTIYILSFVLPIISWIISVIISGVAPFGEKTVLTGDITYQFIDYLAYFKSVILSNNDFVYTFSKTMGGDMAGFSAYYLSSPFNYFLLLFSNRNLPLGFLIMLIFKAGLMGLCFNYYLAKIYGQRAESLFYSTTYALMGYIVVYYQLFAYFDSLILLPLIMLGIHKIYENPKKKLTYIISLFLAIVINYYVGWMLCIFCVLYFAYLSYINGIKKDSIVSFIICSALGGMMTAYKLLPALLSMRGEKDNFNFGICRNFKMIDLFSRLYPDSFKGNISTCLPNIYCGLLVLIFVVIYFFNKNISKKEKIAGIAMLGFLLINMYISILNIVWHGLNQPIGFPYRYSFLLIVMLLIVSYKGFIEMEKQNIIYPVVTFSILFFGYSIYLLVFGSEVVTKREIILSIVYIVVYFLLIYIYRRNSIKYSLFVLLLFGIYYSELIQNQVNSFNYFDMANQKEYRDYIDQVGEIIDEINKEDSSFFRLEKYFRRSHNDAMQFQYNGLTHYSSCEKKEYINFMGKMGFRDNGNWSFYDRGSTTFVDSLFGIKYIISQFDSTGKPYEKIMNKYDYYVFKNNLALPMAFAANEGVRDVTINKNETNTFEIQNRIADKINGKNNNIFIEIEGIQRNIVNLDEEQAEGYTLYKKINPEEDAYIEYIIPLSDKIAECYFAAPSTQEVELWLNGEFIINYFNQYSWNVYDLGTKNKQSTEISIQLHPNNNEMKLSGEYFYYEDFDALKNWYNDTSEEKCELNKNTSSKLSGEIEVESDKQLVFSFPYEDEWNIKINGTEYSAEKSAGIFLSVPIKKGKNSIEINYKPAGKNIGMIISIISLILLIVDIIAEKHYILCKKK